MAIALDTMKFIALLREAGVDGRHAESIARAVKSEVADIGVGKEDLSALATKADLGEIHSDVRVLKWMMGCLLAIIAPVVSAILYNFFAG